MFIKIKTTRGQFYYTAETESELIALRNKHDGDIRKVMLVSEGEYNAALEKSKKEYEANASLNMAAVQAIQEQTMHVV